MYGKLKFIVCYCPGKYFLRSTYIAAQVAALWVHDRIGDTFIVLVIKIIPAGSQFIDQICYFFSESRNVFFCFCNICTINFFVCNFCVLTFICLLF